MILLHQLPVPGSQLLLRVRLIEPADSLCLQIAVRHADADLLQPVLTRIEICIAFGLGEMNRIR